MNLDVGNVLAIKGTFTDPDTGDHVDPTAVFIEWITPAGVTVTRQHGVDGAFSRLSAGVYLYPLSLDEAGLWVVRMYSTGTGQASTQELAWAIAVATTDPDRCIAMVRVFDDDGAPAAGATVTLQALQEPANQSGSIYSGRMRERVTTATGTAAWVGVPVGAKVKYWRGEANVEKKRFREITITAAMVTNGVVNLPSLVGSENVS
jgi:hypothetical protein